MCRQWCRIPGRHRSFETLERGAEYDHSVADEETEAQESAGTYPRPLGCVCCEARSTPECCFVRGLGPAGGVRRGAGQGLCPGV